MEDTGMIRARRRYGLRKILRVASELAILPILLAVASCAGSGDDSPAVEEAATASAAPADETPVAEEAAAAGYTVIDVTDGGAIRGTIRFAGTVPPPRTTEVDDDVEACGEMQSRLPVTVGENGGLSDVVASLVDIDRGIALEAGGSAPALDQQTCRFEPHVLLAPVGAPVQILNSDPVTHNIHTVTFDNRAVNRAQPAGVRVIEVSFKVDEKVKVKCDIHDWMGAWIIAIEHPYHAITDVRGEFAIEDVPPGTYTLELWHEELGATRQEVTVAAGEVAMIDASMAGI
jgi:plastocyanin